MYDNMQNEVKIITPEGRIEGIYTHSKDNHAPVVMVMHHHPEHGGHMNNKAVHEVHKTFAQLGFSVLRFNFRGVGKSEGRFSEGEQEIMDAAFILDWLLSHGTSQRDCWAVGLSFGSWVAMQLLMRRPEVVRFLAISPPVGIYDFSFLAPCPVSGSVITGSIDRFVDAQEVERMVGKINNKKIVNVGHKIIANADHFFNYQLTGLTQAIKEYVNDDQQQGKKVANFRK